MQIWFFTNMTFRTVRECPSTEETWQQRAKKCTRSDHYHCLLNENAVVVEGCINPIWIEPGNCPVYNAKAFKLDAQKCRTQVCPNGVYRSYNLFKYNGCLTPKGESEAPGSVNVNNSTQQNKTTLGASSQSLSSVPAVVIPVILVVLFLAVIAAAIVWYKRKRCRGNKMKTTQQQTEKEKGLEQEEMPLSDQNAPDSNKGSKNNRLRKWRILSFSCNETKTQQKQTTLSEREGSLETEETLLCGLDIEEGTPQRSIRITTDYPLTKDSIQSDGSESFTRDELLKRMNINIEEIAEEASQVSEFAIVLRENKTLALIGEWGSGKRTLAVQIALEIEKMVSEKFQFKVIYHFDEKCEPIISGLSQPTVIILPDLFKLWCTDQHIKDVKNSLIRIRSIAKDNKLYIIALSTENAWTTFTSFFPNENVSSLFPRRMNINLSSKTLSKVGEINKLVLKETEVKAILKTKIVIGKPLITILFCKNLAYRNMQFLKKPLDFILSELRNMRSASDMQSRTKFRVLEYMMFHDGKVDREKLENDTDHRLFKELNIVDDKQGYIQGCLTQLLDGYMEETSTGKSYRMLHDVITKCVFLVAAEKEPVLTFKECDPLLLLDCIRLKSRLEKIWGNGVLSFDYSALSIGIPTELFPLIANILKKRNEIMTMLRKVKLFDDKDFQSEWNKIQIK